MTDEQIQQIDKLVTMFCSAVDNLADLPISDEWAAKWAKEGSELLEANDYFRQSAPAAAPTTVVREVQALADNYELGAFRSGWECACDEFFERLKKP